MPESFAGAFRTACAATKMNDMNYAMDVYCPYSPHAHTTPLAWVTR